jgi:hypothetical protein
MRGSMPSMDDPDLIDDLPVPIVPDTPEVARRRSRSRAIFLFVACFFVGVIGAGAWAYKMGYVGATNEDTKSLASYQKRAEKALHEQRWDTPAGDNVKDITNDGLAKFPHDTRLLEVRAQATDELVKDAVAEKYLGHMDRASHFAQLAHELDPTDVAAERLSAEYADVPQAVMDAGVAHDAQVSTHPPSNVGTTVGSLTGPHGSIDLTPGKPVIGAPVTITVRILVGTAPPKALPDSEVLTVTGPNVVPGTMIPILADGPSIVRGAISFLEPGKFELTFTAKVDGTPVKITKLVVIDAPGAQPPSNGTDGGKWL